MTDKQVIDAAQAVLTEGITQTEAARRYGCKQQSVSAYLRKQSGDSAPKRKSRNPRPKELESGLRTHTPYISAHLLEAAGYLEICRELVEAEAVRLSRLKAKDSLVFTVKYQKLIQHWNETQQFTAFAALFKDDSVTTYEAVLGTLQQRLERMAARVASMRVSTGCAPDPHKAHIRLAPQAPVL